MEYTDGILSWHTIGDVYWSVYIYKYNQNSNGDISRVPGDGVMHWERLRAETVTHTTGSICSSLFLQCWSDVMNVRLMLAGETHACGVKHRPQRDGQWNSQRTCAELTASSSSAAAAAHESKTDLTNTSERDADADAVSRDSPALDHLLSTWLYVTLEHKTRT